MPGATQVVFDGRTMRSRDAFFEAFRAIDGVPATSVDNVDALWEVVTGMIERPIDLTWVNAGESRAAMGMDFLMILAVLQEASAATANRPDRPRFTLTLAGAPN